MHLHDFLLPMISGIFVGLLTRILLVQTSYRQFPSRPHGMVIHLFLGFVASLLGALVIPAVIKPDFTAGVFVSIGTAQFHTIRDLERNAWRELDKGEVVPRGPAYIEGMAVTFEARIFLVMAISAVTTVLAYYLHWPVGIICGVILALLIRFWKKGKKVSDFARIKVGQVSVRDGQLLVDDLEVATFPRDSADSPGEFIAIVVEPFDFDGILTLSHHGQQQVLLHNLAVAIGVQAHPHFESTVTYFPKDRKLVLVVLPLLADEKLAMEAVAGAPILEAVIRKPIRKHA